MNQEVAKDRKRQTYSKILRALKFAYFAYYFSVGCIHNFYPVLLKKIKIPNSKIGVISSIGFVGGTISPILVGYLADRTKRSRVILIIISILTIIFHLIPISSISVKIVLDQSKNGTNADIAETKLSFVYMLLVFQFFVTFGDQGTKALLDGVVHKSIGEAAKLGVHCDFARLRMFGGVGIGLATALSGFALDHVKKILPPGFPEEISLVAICLIMGTFFIITLILYVPHVETKEQVSFVSALKDIGTRFDALICFTAQFCIQFALNITRNFETLYIQHLGGNKSWAGIVALFGYTGDVLMMYLSPTITDAIGSRESTVGLGTTIAFVRCLFYGFADSKYMSMNNAILNGFSLGLIIPTMSSLIKSKAPEHLISSYVSLLTATGKVGGTIASAIGGIISEKYSYTVIFVISSFFFLFCGIMIVGVMNLFNKTSKSKKSKVEMFDEEIILIEKISDTV